MREQLSNLNKQNNESYKSKYEALLVENKKLKEQLEKAYTVW